MLGRLLKQLAGRLDAARDLEGDTKRLVEAGRLDEAERRLKRRLARRPADARALHALGLVCLYAGRLDEAVERIGAAAAIEPNALFHSNLAQIWRLRGRLDCAEAEARKAVSLEPEDEGFMRQLALVLADRRKTAEALGLVERLLAGSERNFEVLVLAGHLNGQLRRWTIALERFREALELNPGAPAALVGLHRATSWVCDWSYDRQTLVEMLERWAAHPQDPVFDGLHPFVAYEVDVSPRVRDAVTQAYVERFLRRVKAPARSFDTGTKDRLRIGYVSADYHNHPTMHLMRGLFRHHDRARFEIYAYSLADDDGSGIRDEIAARVAAFRDLREATDDEATALILADRIDILVDLKGFTLGARPGIFAARPAPVRVAWLGYPASTGRGLNDYMIADAIVVPPGCDPHFGEALVRMPHTYQVNDDEQPIDCETPSREALGLPPDGVVYACFNHVYKLDPALFAVWMRILARVPGSVLWLYSDDEAPRANLRREAQKRGIDPGRLVFAGTLPKAKHLARLKQADLFLDTRLINAHTGASDALWAGLPVLTSPGEGFPSRVAASLLHAAGLPELVCNDLAEYEEQAVALGLQRGRLAALRRYLEEKHAALPLFDTARFARHLEWAYGEMWRRHVAGLPPAPFDVPKLPAL